MWRLFSESSLSSQCFSAVWLFFLSPSPICLISLFFLSLAPALHSTGSGAHLQPHCLCSPPDSYQLSTQACFSPATYQWSRNGSCLPDSSHSLRRQRCCFWTRPALLYSAVDGRERGKQQHSAGGSEPISLAYYGCLLNKRSPLPVAWINLNKPSHLPLFLSLYLPLILSLFLSFTHSFFLSFISVGHRLLSVSLAATDTGVSGPVRPQEPAMMRRTVCSVA